MSIGLAFKAFFAAIFDRQAALRIQEALQQDAPSGTPRRSIADKASEKQPPTPKPQRPVAVPGRSDALTLLATLQREAKLIDFVMEPLDNVDDAQVGAVVRNLLSDCRKCLQRIFQLVPISDAEEGSTVAVDATAPPSRQRIVGASSISEGVLVHPGWKSEKLDLPKWSGNTEEANFLAPVEIAAK